MCDMLQECLSHFLKIEALELEQSKALELHPTGCDALVILPTGYQKS